VILRLSENASDAVVQVIASLIDAGRGSGIIELLDRNARVLASLRFSRPSSAAPNNGVLKFLPINEDPSAKDSGLAVMARVLDDDRNLVFECDVSDKQGDGVIKLNTNQIVAGGPVRIGSFTLMMPNK
jgi:hypothetical protein